MSRWLKIKTLAALGPASLARVALYRLGLKSGRHPVQRISASAPHGPVFAPVHPRTDLPPANMLWQDKLSYFGWLRLPAEAEAPDWHLNPFTQHRHNTAKPWWQIPDFVAGEDIKGVWELSRFGWLCAMATQAAHGDEAALQRINRWLQDWMDHNPPYLGVQWKCGQEASLRVIHLLAAALILDQDQAPQPALLLWIALHLKRIAPTLSYAIGQNNNHGTSEAIALYVGGRFLAAHGHESGASWAKKGRRWLENRAATLIAPDGSFSQYSLVYHRLMLDSFAFAEIWRRRCGDQPFSDRLQQRMASAVNWLDAMVDRTSGDAPNLGANDGAHILPINGSAYRDFRPSLQLSSLLFKGQRALNERGPWDDQARWLGISTHQPSAPTPISHSFDNGGYHVLRAARSTAIMRYPRFAFRPSQCDALHVDLWADGRNLLRDAGTFSYNSAAGVSEYFSGNAGHNVVQFDDHDQMPRLGRFLFAAWPKAQQVAFQRAAAPHSCAAAFTDHRGHHHHRSLTLENKAFRCVDHVDGSFAIARLRWRLIPDDYRLEGQRLIGSHISLQISSDDPSMTLALVQGAESLHYLQQSPVPILEITMTRPGQIITEGSF